MKRKLQTKRIRRTAVGQLLFVVGIAATVAMARESAPIASPSWEGPKTAWHGFDRYDFLMDEGNLAIKAMRAADDEKDGIKHQVEGRSEERRVGKECRS